MIRYLCRIAYITRLCTYTALILLAGSRNEHTNEDEYLFNPLLYHRFMTQNSTNLVAIFHPQRRQ
jgi:hypothetical protein